MYPDLEVHELISITRMCEKLALAGNTEEGYRRLRVGVCRAEELHRSGEFWSLQLLSLWQCALQGYRRRHAPRV